MAGGNKSGLLTELDELFTTQAQRDDAQREKVIDIPLNEIHDFPNHPFRVVQDDAMNEMAESVKQFGVLVPAMVRPADGGYELISGHRRKMASTLAGRDSLPCIVRDLSDDEAIIVMVDSNLQREQLLPSEKAKAYKMKLEAMKRQGRRTDLTSAQPGHKLDGSDSITSRQVVGKLEAADLLGKDTGDSGRQIQRYIRLNNLVPEILSLVDEGKIGMTPAVELSYIPQDEQKTIFTAIDSEQNTPSLSQAKRMRKMSAEGKLNDDTALSVMMEQKKPDNFRLVLDIDKIRGYFPKNYTADKMEETIVKLLAGWARQRTHDKGAR
jgi:ParB family chromosome partitioning protein